MPKVDCTGPRAEIPRHSRTHLVVKRRTHRESAGPPAFSGLSPGPWSVCRQRATPGMDDRITATGCPGAPGPLTESARERAWDDFGGRRRDPDVPPLLRVAWVGSRDSLHVDRGLERSPL